MEQLTDLQLAFLYAFYHQLTDAGDSEEKGLIFKEPINKLLAANGCSLLDEIIWDNDDMPHGIGPREDLILECLGGPLESSLRHEKSYFVEEIMDLLIELNESEINPAILVEFLKSLK